MKHLSIIVAILFAGLIAGLIARVPDSAFSVGGVEDAFNQSVRSSSTIPRTATTTNPLLSADVNRKNAKVCYLTGTSTVFLHKLGISTTTGVVLNEGVPLYPTSTQVQTCQDFLGFKGYLFALTEGIVVVTTDYNK